MNTLMDHHIFNDHTLNIFTDASLTKIRDECITCSGAIAIATKNNSDVVLDNNYRILRNSTNNVGEIVGINLGINLALQWRDKFSTVNLFSDSKISLFGLREWFAKWKFNRSTGLLYGSAGTPIANQSYFLKIMYTIIQNNLSINLYHVPGHADFNKFIKVFKESNNVRMFIDRGLINRMIKYNDMIDETTRSMLLEAVKSESFINEAILNEAIQYMYSTDFNMSEYTSLINYNEFNRR